MSAISSNPRRLSGALLIPALLVAAGTLGSYVFACIAPLVAIATIVAVTMPRSMALATVAAAWLANQAVGYGLLDYPVDASSLGWGLAIGVATLIATLAGHAIAARFTKADRVAAYGAVFAGAFVAYQTCLAATSLMLGGGDSFTLEIIAAVGSVNLVALVALALLQQALAAAVSRSPVPTATRQAT